MGDCQSKSYIKQTNNIKQTNIPVHKQMGSKQIQMQTITLTSKLYSIIINQQIEQKDKSILMIKKLQPHIQPKIKQLSQYLSHVLNKLYKNQNIELQTVRQIIVVSSKIIKQTQYYKYYENINKNQINGLALYIQRQNQSIGLDNSLLLIDKMFLDHSLQIYSTSQQIFKIIINKFHQFSTDQIREIATQILIQMMLDNKKLIKYANQPYYFLQYFLYTINQQTQLDRQLYWIESIKKLYSINKQSQDTLFYDNDFKIFIDLLIRVIGQCPNGKTLRIPLQCYLVLSCTKKMKDKLFRLNDVKQFIAQINAESLGVADLAKEINGMKQIK